MSTSEIFPGIVSDWPVIMAAFRTAYDVLHKAGFSDEAILYEMYLSKEPAEVFERIAEQGLFAQLNLHSHTSQYSQLRALLADDGSWLYERFRRVLEQMRAQALGSSLGRAEAVVRGENQDKY